MTVSVPSFGNLSVAPNETIVIQNLVFQMAQEATAREIKHSDAVNKYAEAILDKSKTIQALNVEVKELQESLSEANSVLKTRTEEYNSLKDRYKELGDELLDTLEKYGKCLAEKLRVFSANTRLVNKVFTWRLWAISGWVCVVALIVLNFTMK